VDVPTLAEGLSRLEGERLTSVEFVLDYVQLRFDGPCLSVYTPHHIAYASGKIVSGDAGYCDALCELIGHLIVKASLVEESELSLAFDNGAIWTMSLLFCPRLGIGGFADSRITEKSYSNCFPRVSGNCEAIAAASRNATAQIVNAQLNPWASPIFPMV